MQKCLERGEIPSKVIISRDFVVLLYQDTLNTESVNCQETGEMTRSLEKSKSKFKGFCRITVSRHFPYSKDFVYSSVLEGWKVRRLES